MHRSTYVFILKKPTFWHDPMAESLPACTTSFTVFCLQILQDADRQNNCLQVQTAQYDRVGFNLSQSKIGNADSE